MTTALRIDKPQVSGSQERLSRCPGCDSDRIVIESDKNAIYSCDECSLLFTNPRPTQDFVLKNYCEGGYYKKFVPDANWEKMWTRRIARVLRRAHRGRMLDVGAGIGTQLHLMRQRGFDVVGTEVSTEAIERARVLYGLQLFHGYVEDAPLADASFDVITMWHVFEHLPYPGKTLGHLATKLRKGGYMIVAVPNNSLAQLASRPRYWFAPRRQKLERIIPDVPYEQTYSEIHLIHFAPSSLRAIFAKHGLEIVELNIDNISLRPGIGKDIKYAVRNFAANVLGICAHKALFVCARKL